MATQVKQNAYRSQGWVRGQLRAGPPKHAEHAHVSLPRSAAPLMPEQASLDWMVLTTILALHGCQRCPPSLAPPQELIEEFKKGLQLCMSLASDIGVNEHAGDDEHPCAYTSRSLVCPLAGGWSVAFLSSMLGTVAARF